ncbi:M48 family metallopeptidase [Alteromonas sp. BMJM2]|uniref:M48 family metallopeptidase n=1 Tax=Alteromonas sp. BMJM2 TaxID=2954241 RepID=UPI0022B2D3D5|nr:M48 family metallopeptidase [Alteromonas sp. BMJM2]
MSLTIQSRIQQSQQTKRTQWLLILAATITIVLMSGYQFYTKGVPYFAEKISESLPEQVYEVVDESSLNELDDLEFMASELSDAEQGKIRALFNLLLSKDTHGNRDYKLEFRQWGGKANAMALANGTIIITDSMVVLTDTDQELSAILLHEIGHVEHNHVMESLVSSSIVFVTLTAVLGDISALSDIIVQGAMLGLNQGYSQQAELEADFYAHERMTKKYGDGTSMISIFEKLAIQLKGQHSWLSSHPSFEKRIEKIKRTD